MPIYGVRPEITGFINYYASPDNLRIGDYAVIEYERREEVLPIVSGPLTCLPGSQESDLPQIMRLANEEEIAAYKDNQELARQAKIFCKKRIFERNLDMKMVDVEIYFDRSKFIFYFTAPTRIDFRDLVKDLVREYRARIELRQIGVRHETQMLGAIGNCGQVCCCRRHLRKFAPVTIKMAKEQNLFLNPAKISGICGRLLCCLSYEQDNYEQFHRESPRPGKRYHTAKGVLKVLRVNMFKNSLSAVDENNVETDYTLEEWKSLKPWRSSHDAASNEDADAAMLDWPEQD